MTEFLKMPSDYNCPFCPNHKDDDFVWDKFLNVAVCLGCSYDLFYEITTEIVPPKFHADTVESLTGKPCEWYQLKTLITYMSWSRDTIIQGNHFGTFGGVVVRGISDDEHITSLKEDMVKYRSLRKEIKSRLKKKVLTN